MAPRSTHEVQERAGGGPSRRVVPDPLRRGHVVVADLGELDATVLDRPRAATADVARPAVTAPADEEAGA